jgi:hypothetical protein
MKILKMHLKENYCEVNKKSNLHITYGTDNTRKNQKRSQYT